VLAAFGPLGCASSPTGATGSARLGESFVLEIGKQALVDNELLVRFEALLHESRCPVDVVCIRAGDAVISVVVKRGSGDGPEKEYQLHTGPDGAPSEVEVAPNRMLKLLALEPLPRSGVNQGSSEYRATLRVTAN
jgi:hypothetical protein